MMWLTKLDRVMFFLFGRYEYFRSLFCASTPLFVSTAQWYSLSRNARAHFCSVERIQELVILFPGCSQLQLLMHVCTLQVIKSGGGNSQVASEHITYHKVIATGQPDSIKDNQHLTASCMHKATAITDLGDT